MTKPKIVYLDWAATTPVAEEVIRAMVPVWRVHWGNPSSIHQKGQEARQLLDQARKQVADFLEASPSEIIFTSCASESINLAHKGLVEALLRQAAAAKPRRALQKGVELGWRGGVSFKPLHIITTPIEHKAVLETCHHLEQLGWAKVSYLSVDKTGLVTPEAVAKALQPNTVLVSVMYVNNEVGTVEPVVEIGRLLAKINAARKQKIYYHIDATQAIEWFDCRVDYLGCDLLSFSAHKIQGPKGAGVLFVRKGTPLVRQLDGGRQESKRRAGTENVAFAVGVAAALSRVRRLQKEGVVEKVRQLRDRLTKGVLQIPGVQLTGHPTKRAPHIASFVIEGVEGEALLLLLSQKGICASSGSACTSGSLRPSHVLTAMGIPPKLAHGSIRFSLGPETTQKEIDHLLQVLPKAITQLRQLSRGIA